MTWFSDNTRTLAHNASPDRAVPVIAALVRERWPELWPATPPDADPEFFFVNVERPRNHSMSVSVARNYVRAGGADLVETEVTVAIYFDAELPDSRAGRAAATWANRRLDEMAAAVGEALRRDVPVEFTHATARRDARRAPKVGMAWAAGRAAGDPGVFAALVERGEWKGTVHHDGTPVQMELKMIDEGDQRFRPLEIDASIRGDALDGLDTAAAVAITEAAVAGFMERLTTIPRTSRIRASAQPVPLPRMFYGTEETVSSFIEHITGRPPEYAWATRSATLVPQPGTGAQLDITVETTPDGEPKSSNVAISVERVGKSFTQADRDAWQERADAIAAALQTETGTGGVAPSFCIGAPWQTVADGVRAGLAAMFPSASPDTYERERGTSFVVNSADMGGDVYATVTAEIEPVSDWETRVTFTGSLFGSGVDGGPRATMTSRAAFRNAIAHGATQMRDEIAAVVPHVPTRRTDVGLA